jgi:FMN reductase (NADPH)
MFSNPVVDTLLKRKSIRKYDEKSPSEEVLETIVRAGQQAPFASQLYSLLLSRNRERHPFKAPLLFTICVDLHKMERIMAKRNWQMATYDLSILLFGIQDAALMAENMVIAAESLGLGSCFLGGAAFRAAQIADEYKLPPRVFPLVQLAMGYPAEDPSPRPRYPLDFVLFEDEYPKLSEEQIDRAMAEMDEGYMAQKYYRRANLIIPLEDERAETFTFDTYGWTEHISRKWGQWLADPEDLLGPLALCGFHVAGKSE